MKKMILLILCVSCLFGEYSRYNEPKSEFQEDVDLYLTFSHHKAMAIAIDENNGRYVYWFTYGQPFEKTAKKYALKKCEEAAKIRRVKAPCELYAVGNDILLDIDK